MISGWALSGELVTDGLVTDHVPRIFFAGILLIVC